MGALHDAVFFVALMALGTLLGAILIGSFATGRRGEPAVQPGAVIGVLFGPATGWLVLLSRTGSI